MLYGGIKIVLYTVWAMMLENRSMWSIPVLISRRLLPAARAQRCGGEKHRDGRLPMTHRQTMWCWARNNAISSPDILVRGIYSRKIRAGKIVVR